MRRVVLALALPVAACGASSSDAWVEGGEAGASLPEPCIAGQTRACLCGYAASEQVCLGAEWGPCPCRARGSTGDEPDDPAERIDVGAATCGDGLVQGDETCDDGNDEAADACLADCQLPLSETWSVPLVAGRGHPEDTAGGVMVTLAGDVFVSAALVDDSGAAALWLFCFDLAGEQRWRTRYDPPSPTLRVGAGRIAPHPDDAVIVTGTMPGPTDTSDGVAVRARVVDGGEQWRARIDLGTPSDDSVESAWAVGVTADGVTYVTGSGVGGAGTRGFMVKLGLSGNPVWTLDDLGPGSAVQAIVDDDGLVWVAGVEPGVGSWVRRVGAPGIAFAPAEAPDVAIRDLAFDPLGAVVAVGTHAGRRGPEGWMAMVGADGTYEEVPDAAGWGAVTLDRVVLGELGERFVVGVDDDDDAGVFLANVDERGLSWAIVAGSAGARAAGLAVDYAGGLVVLESSPPVLRRYAVAG